MNSIEEYHKLVEENHNLIYGYLHMYGYDVDDNYDLAAIGLCKAAQTYESNLGFSFGTYAYNCMKREFYHQYESKNRQKRKHNTDVSLDYLKAKYDDSFLSKEYQKDDIEDIEGQILTSEFMSRLNESESDIVSMRLQGFTLQEIGDKYHMTRQGIEHKMKKVKAKYERFNSLRKVG